MESEPKNASEETVSLRIETEQVDAWEAETMCQIAHHDGYRKGLFDFAYILFILIWAGAIMTYALRTEER